MVVVGGMDTGWKPGGLEVGFVSACSWLALVSGVGDCVLAEVEIGGLSCIFL